MKVNKVLSKEMHVKPLAEGELATFELINANKFTNKSSEDGRKLPTNPAVFQITEMDVIYDPVKKTNVQIGNVTSETPITEGGKTRFDPVLKPVWIEDGFITLDHTQNDTYAYMMRINENINNKYRDPKRKATIRLVDAVAEKNARISYDILEDDAIMIVKEGGITDLKAIAAGIKGPLQGKVNQEGTIDEIRFDLRQIIRRGNPEAILKASKSNAAKLKVQIVEAEKWNIISRGPNRTWVDFHDKKITQIKGEETMLDGMVKFFTSKEGKEFYQNEFIPQIKKYISKI